MFTNIYSVCSRTSPPLTDSTNQLITPLPHYDRWHGPLCSTHFCEPKGNVGLLAVERTTWSVVKRPMKAPVLPCSVTCLNNSSVRAYRRYISRAVFKYLRFQISPQVSSVASLYYIACEPIVWNMNHVNEDSSERDRKRDPPFWGKGDTQDV
jgi:hypothetical protein